MLDLKRKCPKCNKEIVYLRKSSFYSARKHEKLCFECAIKNRKKRVFSKKEKDQARQQLKKVTNSRPLHDIWLEKYGKDEADRRLEETKSKHSVNNSGNNNPMFGKPSPQGSGNGWAGWYKNWFFRSLRELSYMINVIEQESLIWEAPDKNFKIPYIDYAGAQRTYFPDFIINSLVIVEIKPSKLHNTPKVLAKKKAAEEFCLFHNMKYELIDPSILTEDEIKKLYIEGKIKFLDKYDAKFRKIYLK